MATLKERNRMAIRILAHGCRLQRIYEKANELEPQTLCKKLFRLENEMHRANEQYCNGYMDEDVWERKATSIRCRIKGILGNGPEVIINGDPRGYALKIDDSIARNLDIHRDMGGYGIIAPDFRE